MVKISRLLVVGALSLSSLANISQAVEQQEETSPQSNTMTMAGNKAMANNMSMDASKDKAMAKKPSPKIDYYDVDNVTNQIPYFDNRFRIDAQLDEVTLLFYRKMGSPPIILVRPDGSKVKVNQHDKESVEWYDDRTFDMIKMKRPMPGPWQAIGQIQPGSHIMVMSEVRLEVAPLPNIMLSGETIKMTGKLFNGELAIDNPSFKDVVRLDVDFYSTNNSAYNNFGAEPVKLTSFRDDGRNLDEYADDGIFTGEFELNFSPGEWIPLYLIKLPMASRELRQQPIIVHNNPITLTAETTMDSQSKHLLNIAIDDTHVDPDSMVFQGKVTFPDKQVEAFSIMEGQGSERIHEISYTEPGVHRVKISAFGETRNGREFRLVVPDFSFNVDRDPNELVATVNENGEIVQVSQEEIDQLAGNEEPKLSIEEELELLKEEQAAIKAAEEKETLLFIGIGNGIILVIAALGYGIFLFLRKRKTKQAAEKSE
ncbi:TIGR03503 family protein [Thalassotalea montiporae]